MGMKAKAHHHHYNASGGSGGGGNGSESSSSTSPSPPPSPRRHSTVPHCRRKLRAKPISIVSSFLLLRRFLRLLVVLPLLYVSGLLMCVGPFSGLVGHTPLPGSVYRSHEMFQLLWPHIQADNSTPIELSSVWRFRRKLKEQKPCPPSASGLQLDSPGLTGYLIVEVNGGLNQQRSAICNAVALAGLLNAVLVIPHFEFHNVWRDPSTFTDIYDEDHFIATLEGHVKVVKELPEILMDKYDHNISNIPTLRVEAWAPVRYYTGEVYPVLQKQGVIRIAPFANRLAMNVPPPIQHLRCLANYEALKFSSAISNLANKLVERMTEMSSRTGGKYVAVHLRFEEDMVAFSCCLYDGGEAENVAMNSIRQKGWGEKFKRKGRVTLPGLNRIDGKCPLTPLEVGMILRGMGFDNSTSIYLASGKIYWAEKHLAPLLKLFPYLHTKESLATPDELAPFEGYSSRLAALDYTVCLFSEIFVTTQGGNFPHFLMGHRRFLYGGHSKTIIPDKRKLVVLLQNMSMSWKDFKLEMEAMLTESDRKGKIIPRVKKFTRKSSVYTYPLPECSCLQKHNNTQIVPSTHS
ncbi:O-fucosyltransferase 10-like [Pyrus communis]|uniref:O-fucosyltransferase 10-like n=1 Tax=Pyrus communis TaxID=23211 RepID=UPI0035BF0E29